MYTKPRGKKPDFGDPLVLTNGRHGITVEAACKQIHRTLLQSFDYAIVWGLSVKHTPQRCGLAHSLCDEDVIQVGLATTKCHAMSFSPSGKILGMLCMALLCKRRAANISINQGSPTCISVIHYLGCQKAQPKRIGSAQPEEGPCGEVT